MQRLLTLAFSLLTGIAIQAQGVPRPKLVVGLVVDQMRWDFLYRYYDRYAPNGGFKRMLNQGFSCENAFMPFAPTVTGPGHSSVYTGSVPAINGITGNLWYDREQRRQVYCSEDRSVNTVGSGSNLGKMSPRNLLVTTIGDELRLATNFRSKVIGVALKDRGATLTAGHSANAAYWYDNTTGDWITSTYYMTELPKWVKDFNAQKLVDKYYLQGWNTLYPINTYVQSSADDKPYEGKPFGANAKGFPYDLKAFAGKFYSNIVVTPMGNTLTTEFAKAAVVAEQLGSDDITDLLAISYSSPDYIGHTFGPNSIEQEDDFLRLDKDLGEFFDWLDSKIGKDQYTVFLTADHGVAHIPRFLIENKIPTGKSEIGKRIASMNVTLKTKHKGDNLIVGGENYQLHLNHQFIDSAGYNKEEIKSWIIDQVSKDSSIARVFDLEKLSETTLNAKQKQMFTNGYYPRRSGDIQLILHAHFLEGGYPTGTSHGLWNPYDSHIPMLWYGWGIRQGKTNRETYMTDFAPTLAALLRIQMPSGSVGSVITEVLK